MVYDLIKMVEQEYLKKEIPPFRPSDTVKVHVKVVEGSREQTQVFEEHCDQRARQWTSEKHLLSAG